MKKLIIFDLDGTLLNTIDDLAAATNQALANNGYPTHPTEAYNFFVGNGINKLFERALPEDARGEAQILRIRGSFLTFYKAHKLDLTRPYDGIPELLLALQNQHLKLAIASNKYQLATQELVGHYFHNLNFIAVCGQQENVPTKPDPTIVENIIRLSDVNKDEVLFVGDSGIDILTAKNAGVTSIGVTWGFRLLEELRSFSPDYIVTKPDEIRRIIEL